MLIFLSLSFLQSNSIEEKVLVFKISGTISVAHYEALVDAINVAKREGASAIIITLSTPGGSLDATLKMITSITNSPIPIIGYVYPSGTTAWSAGTYLLMACHIAAMAPHTVIGSCQPISYSPFGSTPVNDTKIINALISVMSTHAKAHGRNETLAIKFITENLNVDDEEAYAYGVIEVRADSIESLLKKIDGMSINTSIGKVVLKTANAKIMEYEFRFRDALINVISDPMISSLLFLIGLLALIYGLSAPGHGGEIIGAIAILLALIGMGFDINIASLIMMIVGAILLIYELATPGFGLFGISGIILLVFGSLFITPLSPEKWAISGEWYTTFTYSLTATALILSAIFIFIIAKIIQVRKRPSTIGKIIGEVVTAISDAQPNEVTFVLFRGELWQAKCNTGIKKGRKYTIVGKDGPVLILEEIT